jgi:hypothetical protein
MSGGDPAFRSLPDAKTRVANPSAAIRERGVSDLSFPGGRFFQHLEVSGRVANPSSYFQLMKSRDRMKTLQLVNAELRV